MMMSTWEEVAGKLCEICGGPATHYYGNSIICCSCHVGEKDGGIYTAAQAAEAHARILAERQARGQAPEGLTDEQRRALRG
jgi:hypothetical protein